MDRVDRIQPCPYCLHPELTYSNQMALVNDVPCDLDTRQVPSEWRLAMSSFPSPLKSPTSWTIQPEAVEKSAHSDVVKPDPVDRLTHQVPLEEW